VELKKEKKELKKKKKNQAHVTTSQQCVRCSYTHYWHTFKLTLHVIYSQLSGLC